MQPSRRPERRSGGVEGGVGSGRSGQTELDEGAGEGWPGRIPHAPPRQGKGGGGMSRDDEARAEHGWGSCGEWRAKGGGGPERGGAATEQGEGRVAAATGAEGQR